MIRDHLMKGRANHGGSREERIPGVDCQAEDANPARKTIVRNLAERALNWGRMGISSDTVQ